MRLYRIFDMSDAEKFGVWDVDKKCWKQYLRLLLCGNREQKDETWKSK